MDKNLLLTKLIRITNTTLDGYKFCS